MKNPIEQLIKELIKEEKEGNWWDFKLKHHSDTADLLHDILCMANITYNGDRFIIFGVNDDYQVVGIQEGDKRRCQADILDLLRKESFANHKIPHIEMDSIFTDDKAIDVLTIKDEDDKPYYLTKDKNKVRSGVIYSRNGDTNTPKNNCANPHEIENLWKERFGLNKKASERFADILLDFKNWIYDGTSKAFYDIDPDYTIELSELSDYQGNYWWNNALPENPKKQNYLLKYKSVQLLKLPIVRFQNEYLVIPYPNVAYVTYPDKQDGLEIDAYCDLFYYLENSIEYRLFQHIRSIEKPTNPSFSTPIASQIKPPIIKLPFIVCNSENSLKTDQQKLIARFEDFLKIVNSSNEILSIQDDLQKRYAIEKKFSEWAYRIIDEDN